MSVELSAWRDRDRVREETPLQKNAIKLIKLIKSKPELKPPLGDTFFPIRYDIDTIFIFFSIQYFGLQNDLFLKEFSAKKRRRKSVLVILDIGGSILDTVKSSEISGLD